MTMMTKSKNPSHKIGFVLLEILRICILIPLLILVGIDLYVLQSTIFLKDSLPMPFGYGTSIVLSGSMEPALNVDDLIMIHKEPTYAIGDMIVYKDGNSFTVHRLTEKKDQWFITKGDNNPVEDAPFEQNRVKGKVVKVIPGAGKMVNAIRSPIGIILVVVLILVLLEMPYVIRKKRQQNELEQIRREIEELKKE